jgi:hypothetical protein
MIMSRALPCSDGGRGGWQGPGPGPYKEMFFHISQPLPCDVKSIGNVQGNVTAPLIICSCSAPVAMVYSYSWVGFAFRPLICRKFRILILSFLIIIIIIINAIMDVEVQILKNT